MRTLRVSADVRGEIPGSPGVARFEISRLGDFGESKMTDWLNADADEDFIVKTKASGLQPATEYYYRLEYGANRKQTTVSDRARFRTLAGAQISRPVSFTALTCMNYEKFHFEINKDL